MSTTVTVPDIGDFEDVPVIEILVSEGDEVAPEDPLVVLESDKATVEIPAPEAGTIGKILVKVGDEVSEGTPLLELEPAAAETPDEGEKPDGEGSGGSSPEAQVEGEGMASEGAGEPAGTTEEAERPDADVHAGVLVLGSGPGGYTAAFRAADLGLDVVLVERHSILGGVCLNVGCIPSKALLHAASTITAARDAEAHGITFAEPAIDIGRLRRWKEDVVAHLTGGLRGMADTRGVTVERGTATFAGPRLVEIRQPDGGTRTVSFDHAIIAAGSEPITLPGLPADDPRVMDSTGALELADVPERLLVIGGGIIGLEMATVYSALGSRITVVEIADQLIPGADADLVRPLAKSLKERGVEVRLGTKVESVEAADDALHATFSGKEEGEGDFDRVLVAVGRRANGDKLGLDAAGVRVDDRGVIGVDAQMRTSVRHIHAIGDVVGGPMLAHKATHEGAVAAEVIAGRDVAFDARAIPSVAYTDPEVAWVGLTETEAKERGIAYEKGVFPWAASGRALSMDGGAGQTKLLVDPESRRVLGGAAVGRTAGELMAEIGLAIEMGAEAGDVALTIHAHPTLTETVGLTAEVLEGVVTDLPPKRRRS